MATSLDIIIQAQDKASAVFQKVGSESSSLGDKLKSLAPALAGLAAGFLSFKGIESAISKTTEFAGSVRTLARETGLGAEDASRLEVAFNHVGLSGDDASRSLGIFAKNLTIGYEQGLGFSKSLSTVQKVFDSMGVATLDANNKMRGTIPVLLDVADKFKGMQDGAEKTGIAMQLFGKSGKDMIPILNQGSDGIKALEAQADKLGLTLTQNNLDAVKRYTLSQRDMNEALSGLKLQIGLEVMPVLTQFANWFVDHQPQIRKFFDDAIAKVEEFAKNTEAGLKIVKDALSWIPDNQGMIILAIAAIGTQMLISFGPESAAVAGLLLILDLIGKVSRQGEGASKLPGLYQQQADLQDQISKLGVGSYRGLPPNLPQPGSPADRARMDKVSAAQDQLAKVNDQIAHFEEVESNAGKTADVVAPKVEKVSTSLSALPPAADKTKEKTDKLAEAMLKLRDNIDSALDDGRIDFKEFTDLNKQALKDGLEPLTAAYVGHMEASVALRVESDKAAERLYDFTSTMTKLTDVFGESTKAGKQLIQTMGQEVLTKLQDAASSLFGKPTQEQATLQLQLAQAQLKVAGFAASGATDAQLAQLNALTTNIGKQVALESAKQAVLQAQLTQADQTLLTDKQQNDLTRDLIPMIRDQSTYTAQLNRELQQSPQAVRDATDAFRQFTYFWQQFIQNAGSVQLAARGV